MDFKKILSEIAQGLIAIAVLFGLGYSMFKLFGAEVPVTNREILMTIVGFLVAKAGTIVDWYFGSSRGSSEKTDALVKSNSEKADA